MSTLPYFIREAWANLRVNRWVTIISILTLSLTLMIFGLFLLVYVNVAALSGGLRESVGITVFLKDDAKGDSLEKLQEQIAKLDGVSGTRYVSREQALEQFQKDLGGDIDLTRGLGFNPLPASIEVSIAPGSQKETKIGALASRIERLPGIEDVQYNQEWVRRLNLFLRFLQGIGLAVGLLLGLAGMAIIANTIRLKVYTRREEIEVMKFIGATDSFIQVPYLLEGIVLGVLAAAVSVLLLAGAYNFFEWAASDDLGILWMGLKPVFLPWTSIAFLFTGGAILGGIGSLMSVKRFIRV